MGRVAVLAVPMAILIALMGAGPARGAEEAELDRLRAELREVSARLSAAEARLARAASQDQVAALARTVEALDDGAYEEAVELGIARRFAAARTGLTPEGERRAASAVVREARAAGLDPLLVASVIEVESSFRNHAVSPVGAVGLMQVMPGTGAWFGARIGLPRTTRDELFDPERNVAVGTRYLAELIRRFGRLDHALIAYNAGPGRAREVIGTADEARYQMSYARKVVRTQNRLRREASLAEARPGQGTAG